MTVEVPLSRGLVAIVDDEDAAAVLAAGKWCASRSPSNRTWYAVRGVRRPGGGRTTLRLHNWLTGLPYVDHADRDGLNNTRANLRPGSHATNGRNVDRRANNTSGHKGVSWAAHTGRWRALITVDGHRAHLGYFPDPIDAAHAYDRAALELHGEYAALNFPREDYT